MIRKKPALLASAFTSLVTILSATGILCATTRAQAELLSRTKIVLPSAIAVDLASQSVTLPLHRGHAGRKTVWYIITDSSDEADAKSRGVMYAPKLAQIEPECAVCVAHVHTSAGEIAFNGAPDFSKAREYVPGATGFPPTSGAPGAAATGLYSPFVRIDDSNIVINAPIVASGTMRFDLAKHSNTHDRVLAIDTMKSTVTLLLAHGFANGKEVLYISTEASDPIVAAIERATYVPSLKGAGEATIPVFAVTNGPRPLSTAQPQGLAYASLDGNLGQEATLENATALHASMNVFGSFPTGADPESYTPLWAANVGVWTDGAVEAGANIRLTSPRDFTDAASRGVLTGPDGKKFGPIGVNVNCPVVAYLDGAP